MKYNDFYEIPGEFVRLIIREFGYDYILEVLSFTDSELKDMLAYMSVVHALKGHKEGLELVLNLLDIKYKITEWWEESPKGTPDTFSMDINVNLSRVLPDTSKKLRQFVSHYVYPIMKAVKMEYFAELWALEIVMFGACKTTVLPGEQMFVWCGVQWVGVYKNVVPGIMS